MRRLTVLLMLLCATAGVGACGGDDTDDRPDGPPAGGERTEAPASLAKCLEDAELEVESGDGDLIRATDPESDSTAEITNFATGAEASRFANQQDVATQAGKLVAVYSSNSDPTQPRVDKCISTAG